MVNILKYWYGIKYGKSTKEIEMFSSGGGLGVGIIEDCIWKWWHLKWTLKSQEYF